MSLNTLIKIHLAFIITWAIQIPVAVVTGLKQSVSYLVFISLAANLISQIEAWQSARMAKRLEKLDDSP